METGSPFLFSSHLISQLTVQIGWKDERDAAIAPSFSLSLALSIDRLSDRQASHAHLEKWENEWGRGRGGGTVRESWTFDGRLLRLFVHPSFSPLRDRTCAITTVGVTRVILSLRLLSGQSSHLSFINPQWKGLVARGMVIYRSFEAFSVNTKSLPEGTVSQRRDLSHLDRRWRDMELSSSPPSFIFPSPSLPTPRGAPLSD